MDATREDFEHWLFDMDEHLAEFIGSLPAHISGEMDYSVDSLTTLEKWLLTKYQCVQDILKESEKQTLDHLSRYVGETLRKNVGGIWNIDLQNKKNVYYRMPVIERQGRWTECPVSLVTAAMDRRSGDYMAGVLRAIVGRYGDE